VGATERSVTPADAAELRQLRSRAYGPDADISRDPAAQARLSELEAAIGRRVTSLDGAPRDGAPVDVSDGYGGSDSSALPEGDLAPTGPQIAPTTDSLGHATPHTTSTTRPSGPRMPWWRQPAGWVVGGFLLVAIVGLVSSLPALLPDAPDHTLSVRAAGEGIPRSDRQELNTHGLVSYLGLVADELRLYDDFRGINVWSAPTEYGTTCLFLTTRSQGMWGVACAPPETTPQLELNQYEHELVHRDDQDPWRDMPWGSLIRLRLQGDEVLVWDYPAPASPVE